MAAQHAGPVLRLKTPITRVRSGTSSGRGGDSGAWSTSDLVEEGPMVTMRDSPTVAAAKRGDDAAFRALFRSVQPLLLRYLSVTAPAHHDDIAAETWARVVRDIDRFHGDDDAFRAWVFAIARHRRVDAARSQQRDRTTPVAEPPDRPAPDDVPAQVDEIVSTEAALRLIATLPPSEAEVVLLRVVAGLDVPTVASITSRRPGTVRVLAHRGLRRLAERLHERGHVDEVTLPGVPTVRG
jgi:RNA polymerase sigma-70 factor (ECF subfamily)